MVVRIRTLITFALFTSLFAGWQGGLYYAKNRLQEVGLLALGALFLYGLIHSAFILENKRWRRWVFNPTIAMLLIVLGGALAYARNTGAPVLPSILAARYFGFILLAPVLYLLYKLGYAAKSLERVIIFTFIAILINYLLFYFTMDLPAAYFSSDRFTASLVVFDEWRGYRLKAPMYIIFLIALYCSMSLFQYGSIAKKLVLVFALLTCLWVIKIFSPRALIATVLLATACYPMFFRRPASVNKLIAFAPIATFFGAIAAVVIYSLMLELLKDDWSLQVRMESYNHAIGAFLVHPLSGFGQASFFSIPYSTFFGPKFAPSDLGLIGVAFKYGTFGVLAYLYLSFFIVYRLLVVNWAYKHYYGTHNPLIWALLVFFTSLLFNLPLQPALVFPQGLTVGVVAIGLTSIYYDEFALHRRLSEKTDFLTKSQAIKST